MIESVAEVAKLYPYETDNIMFGKKNVAERSGISEFKSLHAGIIPVGSSTAFMVFWSKEIRKSSTANAYLLWTSTKYLKEKTVLFRRIFKMMPLISTFLI